MRFHTSTLITLLAFIGLFFLALAHKQTTNASNRTIEGVMNEEENSFEAQWQYGNLKAGMQCCSPDLPISLASIPCICVDRSSSVAFLERTSPESPENWKDDTIPLLVIAVFNSDRILPMVATIDMHVEHIVVLQDGPPWFEEMPEIIAKVRDMIPRTKVEYFLVSERTGVSGMWNMPMRLFPHHPFWMMPEDDIAFYPGQLLHFYRDVLAIARDSTTNIGWIEPRMRFSPESKIFQDGSYAFWGMTRQMVLKAGLWDENNFPAFCEEIDGDRRRHFTGVGRLQSQARILHNVSIGAVNDTEYHSGTMMSDKGGRFRDECSRTASHCMYVAAKWKCKQNDLGYPVDCQYDSSYNKGDVKYWKFLRKRWKCILGMIPESDCKFRSDRLARCMGCLDEDEYALFS